MAGDRPTPPVIRQASVGDAQTIADIHLRARKVNLPYLPDLHSNAETLAFFKTEVLTAGQVWLAEQAGAVFGFIAQKPGWIDHLYVAPGHQRAGIGSRLLTYAKNHCDDEDLKLWTFQRNMAARRFYEKHGFHIIEKTNGVDNEEKEPDLLYLWER